MKLEEIVCDLKYSKRLKELGVIQDTLFFWANEGHGDFAWCSDFDNNIHRDYPIPEKICSAFITDELGKMLIEMLIVDRKRYLLAITKGWHLSYEPYVDSYAALTDILSADKQSNAYAMMLIHIIEKGFVKAQELIL